MTITSTVYSCVEINATGDTLLYTVPAATTSRIMSVDTGVYGSAGSLFDVSLQVISPGGTIAPWLFAPYLSAREGILWNGILNLTTGYQLQIYIGASDGTVAMGVLVTGEDFT